MITRRKLLVGGGALAGIAAARLWTLPSSSERADQLRDDLLATWSEVPAASGRHQALRAQNPEYDLMARTFGTLALVDAALAGTTATEPALAAIDTVLAGTLAEEERWGQPHFLLPYVHHAPFLGSGRSLFVDGEVLVMLGARRTLAADRWSAAFEDRARWVREALDASPHGGAESYPDECWTFCNTMAQVGLRLHEHLEGADHASARDRWLALLRQRLVDPTSGMLVSSFGYDGAPQEGPEGSSLWLSATGLLLTDPALARTQYTRARQALGGSLVGLGYAREWPDGTAAAIDVDSGPLVPVLGASASSSGLALLAARAFGDHAWRRRLERALAAAEAVMTVHPTLAAAADNAVGDAVLACALGFGPLWEQLARP